MEEYIKGNIDIINGQYGFVEAENETYFISKNNLGNSISGDYVLCRVIFKGDKKLKPEAQVIKVLRRERDSIVGIFKKNDSFGFIISSDLGKDIYVNRKNFNGAKDNEIVVADILNWGNNERKPEGVIKTSLGSYENSENLMKALLIKYGYSEKFNKNIINSLKESLKKEILIKGRKDLRNLPIITIDGEDAKDFDDAVYVKKNTIGNYILIVSIADVSYYVEENSIIDLEARKRGNSVYLCDRVIPMLPEELSNDLCSLKEGEDRLTFSVELEFDTNGKIISENFYKSVIRSKYRMTYKNVNKIFEKDPQICEKYGDIIDMLELMRELSCIIRKCREERGSIDFDIPEIKILLDEKGKLAEICERERGISEKIIEDFMIATNEAVAEKIFWINFPMIYRIHEKPDIVRMKVLNEFISKFGLKLHNLDDIHPGKFQKIIKMVYDNPNKKLINKMILMSLKRAKYSTNNLGHFGLASKCYTHFTSPIRRYADLVVHRILSNYIYETLDYKNIDKILNQLKKISEWISVTERKAEEAEEESLKIKIIEYMKDKIGTEYSAVITGINKNNIFVNTKEGIECYIDIKDLGKDFYFDEKNYKILEKNSIKEYNIGNEINIFIIRVDLEKLKIRAGIKDVTCK